MRAAENRLGGLIAILAAGAMLSHAAGVVAEETALDVYVHEQDASYGWRVVGSYPGDGVTVDVLELTSQTWRSSDEVDRPEWKHWLTLVRPNAARAGTAMLYIGGGSNRRPAPERASERFIDLALGTNTVVAELGMVPNQPLHFSDTPEDGRSEDDLVAYSRMRYIDTGDPRWLVRLPMVKSGVRAMDAMQEYLATEAGGELDVKEFLVAGGSKRGWTTWLVGAVDERVSAIVPLVIDALNTEAITRHHLAAYGFFSPALNDYVRHGLYPDKVGTPEYREILQITDPYNYRDRERMQIPKYVVNSAGDQFFLPDNSRFYFAELQAPKFLRYVPNTKHNLAGSDAMASVQAFYQAVLDDVEMPTVTWTREKDASMIVTVDRAPVEAKLWQATNPEARDFRLDTIGPAYASTTLEATSEGRYVARVDAPEKGFTAFFAEFTYDVGGTHPLKLTTGVSVAPDVLPFADKVAGD